MSVEIDNILSSQLIGALIDQELSLEMSGLKSSHPFYWETIQINPKGDHGIYEIRGFNSSLFLTSYTSSSSSISN